MSSRPSPIIDLTAFPITAVHTRSADEAPHMVRAHAVCNAVAAALGLPPGVALDAHARYATLSFCGLPDVNDATVSYRMRVNGFAFGQGSKKTVEYLGLSVVALDQSGEVVGWSEDLGSMKTTAAYWAAFHAGTPLPKAKNRPQDCALLTFVGADGKETPITPALRALVAARAAPAAVPKAKPAKKKS